MTRRRRRPERPSRNARPKSNRKGADANGKTVRGQLREMKVIKPYCAPVRSKLYNCLEPYGIPIVDFIERPSVTSIRDYAAKSRIELRTFENLKFGPLAPMYLPLHYEATFKVPAAQAAWAEYLIESTKRLHVAASHRINKKNRAWGNRRSGMPTPWNAKEGRDYARAGAENARRGAPPDGKAWIEDDCTEGNDIWKQVQEIRKKESKKNVRK